MAHFAKLGINGKIIGVHAVNNSDTLNGDGVEDETVGQQFLENIHGWPALMWIQTSYNTRAGKHIDPNTGEESADQTKALRGNYAGIGKIWDEEKNIFYFPQPYASWTLNESTAMWEPPTPRPADSQKYEWNEGNASWDIIS